MQIFEKAYDEGKMVGYNEMVNKDAALMALAPDEILRIDQNMFEFMLRSIPGLILAKDRAEFDAMKEDVIRQMWDLGAQESIDWWTAEYERCVK